MRAIVLATALVGSLLLTGCGIKGPLYLPDIPASRPAGGADHTKAAPAPAPTPATPDSR